MRKLLLCLFLTLPIYSYADVYTWISNVAPGKYPSPSASCAAAIAQMNSTDVGSTTTLASMRKESSEIFTCVLRITYQSGAVDIVDNYLRAIRSGNSCQDGATYNETNGECEKPPEPEPSKCEGRAGQQRTFQKKGTIGDGWFSVTGNGFGVHPQENCVEGCQAWTEGVKCKYNNLIGNVYLCRGTANLTGAECGTSGADAEETDDKTLPEPDRIVDKKPCVYKTNQDGTQTCESESSDYQDGQHCGDVNGVRKCLDKAPEKNGIDIRTDIKTEPTSDGGTKTTKTDVTTKTECKNGKCSTSTTTRTTTTTKDANGKTSSVSGTCTGKDCKEKNEDPDGDGLGGGKCTGKDCGDDPFDEGMGEGGFYEPGTDTFESVLTTFQAGVKGIPVVQGAGNFLAFSPSGSCPSGSINVMGMPVQLDQWCGSTIPWELIKSVIMAVAAFLAYRIAFL